jgi:hypothetical protein
MFRPFLLHAHPGHELRLFHWMELNRPVVFWLTDGSGSDAASRIEDSWRCVARAGAECGDVPGPRQDRAWYETILRGDPDPFRRAVDRLVGAAVARRTRLIVSDAVDGYNPMHDLCEAMGAAVAARVPDSVHLVSRAVAGGDVGAAVSAWQLDPAAVERKRAAVDAYGPLAEEARRLLEADASVLAVERLRRPSFAWPEHHTPAWEETGRARVASQRYGTPIEYVRHVRPIARAILDAAGA